MILAIIAEERFWDPTYHDQKQQVCKSFAEKDNKSTIKTPFLELICAYMFNMCPDETKLLVDQAFIAVDLANRVIRERDSVVVQLCGKN